jgi:hypothetical protein
MSTSPSVGHLLRAAAIAAVVVGTLAVMSLVPTAKAAPVFTVIEPSDAPDAKLDGACASTKQGLCTLRAAVQEAEFAGGGDIVLSQGVGSYTLSIPGGSEVDPAAAGANGPNGAVGDLDISKAITITGQGPSESVIDGGNSVRVFDVHAGGILTLKGVRVENGKADYDGATGHIHGGGIHNHGTVHLFNTVVDDNTANTPNWGGGGITNATGATATLENVTVAKNATAFRGGGIENLGNLSMTNVTIADNSAPAGTAGGLLVGGGTTSLTNTLLANNGTGNNCLLNNGLLSSGGYNLDSDQSCGMAATGDLRFDPGLDPGIEGKGPLYYALDATSKAVDAGNPGTCPSTDVRGATRPKDGDGDGTARCDIGSYERDAATTQTGGGGTKKPSFSIADVKLKEGDSGTKTARFSVKLSAAASGTVTVKAATSSGTATSPSDFKAKTQTLTFKAGTLKKTFGVKVNGDTRKEPDETFKVRLSSASGVSIADNKATGTIQNDD